MTLQQLKDLLSVVSHGGYRAAARALGVSQAGLTRSLAKLEEEFGVTLLQRTHQGIVPTCEGESLLQYARAIVLEANRAEDWLRNLKSPAPQQIKLGVSLDPSLRLAPVVLKDFRACCPDVTIHVTQRSSSELLAAIREYRLDIVVCRLSNQMSSSGLVVDVLYKSSAKVMARKGHPLGHASSIHDLANCEWIVVGDPSKSGQEDDSIQELFVQRKITLPRFAAVSDSLFGAISVLLESDCVARFPSALLDHPLGATNLAEIKVREQNDLPYDIGIIYKARRQLGKETTQLVSMLKSFSRLLQGSQVCTVSL